MALQLRDKLSSLQALKEVDTLRNLVGNYEKDKAALTQSKARLLQSEKHLKHLEWENEVRHLHNPSLQQSAHVIWSKTVHAVHKVL